jgi:hypothetical protein
MRFNPFPPEGVAIVKMYGNPLEEQYFFDVDGLRRLLNCGVYYLANEKENLYIGSAKNVLNRISDPNHESFRMGLCEAQWMRVDMKKSEKWARDDEGREIAIWKPRLNKTGKNNFRPYHELW